RRTRWAAPLGLSAWQHRARGGHVGQPASDRASARSQHRRRVRCRPRGRWSFTGSGLRARWRRCDCARCTGAAYHAESLPLRRFPRGSLMKRLVLSLLLVTTWPRVAFAQDPPELPPSREGEAERPKAEPMVIVAHEEPPAASVNATSTPHELPKA